MRTTSRFLTSLLFLVGASALVGCGPGNSRSDAQRSAGSSVEEAENSADASTASARNSDFSVLPAPYSDANYSLGRRTFKNCGSCHTLRESGQNLVGPNLYGIIGRQAGSLDNFNYSPVLQDADFIWTPERLEEWLGNPRGFLPGNNMTFAGVHRPDDRRAVIAYVMLETGYQAEPAEAAGASDTTP